MKVSHTEEETVLYLEGKGKHVEIIRRSLPSNEESRRSSKRHSGGRGGMFFTVRWRVGRKVSVVYGNLSYIPNRIKGVKWKEQS